MLVHEQTSTGQRAPSVETVLAKQQKVKNLEQCSEPVWYLSFFYHPRTSWTDIGSLVLSVSTKNECFTQHHIITTTDYICPVSEKRGIYL